MNNMKTYIYTITILSIITVSNGYVFKPFIFLLQETAAEEACRHFSHPYSTVSFYCFLFNTAAFFLLVALVKRMNYVSRMISVLGLPMLVHKEEVSYGDRYVNGWNQEYPQGNDSKCSTLLHSQSTDKIARGSRPYRRGSGRLHYLCRELGRYRFLFPE